MRKCLFCGCEFEPNRKDQVYCSSRHRVYASRQRKASKERADRIGQELNLKAMIEQLRKIAPKTAQSMEAFQKAHGFDCSYSAVKLALTAFHEARSPRA